MALVQLLRTMHWPVDVVEAPAFVQFVNAVAPKYMLPSKEELLQYFTMESVQDAPLDLSCQM